MLRKIKNRKDISHKVFSYHNGTVLYVPDGAVDPFHTFNETPRMAIKLFQLKGFELIEQKNIDDNHIFLAFRRVSSRN